MKAKSSSTDLKKIWLNLEGQFFDATAVAGNLNFAF
jgi:hypothetical protein